MPAVPPESEADAVPEAEPVSRSLSGDTVAVPQLPRAPGEVGWIGDYRVLGLLGKGGMGTVFRAHDASLNREVALKVMRPECAADAEARKRFLREARAQAAVEHDHIILIWHVGEDNGTPFIVMPLLKGRTLAAALRANPDVPTAEVLRIGREMAGGLGAAHVRGLIHRDVKPSNVWLEGDRRRVKILDFGLARADHTTKLDSEDGPLTALGAVLGTPQYMAPEQARGEELDHRGDLFSLGVVLYQMCTGRLPFTGQSAHAILIALAVEEPTPPAAMNESVPGELSDLIMRLLAKDPVDRPMSADEVADELERIEQLSRTFVPVPMAGHASNDPWASLDNTETTDAPSGGPLQPRKPERKRPGIRSFVWLLLAVLPLAGLAFGVAQLLPSEGTFLLESEVPDAELVVTGEGGEVARLSGGEVRLPAGRYQVTLAGATPDVKVDLREFELSRGGRVTAHLWRKSKPVPVAVEPDGSDRAAAIGLIPYADLKLILPGDEPWSVRRGEPLPPGRMWVREIAVPEAASIDRDAFFPHLAGLRDIHRIVDWFNRVRWTEADFDRLAECPCAQSLVTLQLPSVHLGAGAVPGLNRFSALRSLDIGATKFDDAALEALATALPELRLLSPHRLGESGGVTTKGISAIARLPIDHLSLRDTKWLDRSWFPVIAGMPRLRQLVVGNSNLDDAMLPELARCSIPSVLSLTESRVTDAGLPTLAGMTTLKTLSLNGNRITDDGLVHLRECHQLRALSLVRTQVTADGVKQLATTLPTCRIEWDGGVIEPIEMP